MLNLKTSSRLINWVIYYWAVIFLIGLACFRVLNLCKNNLFTCAPKDTEIISETGFIKDFRQKSRQIAQTILPSPHSELLLGMTVGIDDLKMVPKFTEALRKTGTIHIVVVSGFNITLVFTLILGFLGNRYKLKNMLLAQGGVVLYAIITGMEAPVVRALIMGSIAAWQRFYGSSIDGLRLLLFSGASMVVFSPNYAFSLSFWLSFIATLSLILFGELTTDILGVIGKGATFIPKVFIEDFGSSVSVLFMVWPLLSFTFGKVSILSPFINAIILWTVPLSTLWGLGLLAVGFINLDLARVLAFGLYVPLDVLVSVVNLGSKISFMEIPYQIRLTTSMFYFLGLMVFRYFYFIYLKK